MDILKYQNEAFSISINDLSESTLKEKGNAKRTISFYL
jgi:hypothetical protein